MYKGGEVPYISKHEAHSVTIKGENKMDMEVVVVIRHLKI